MDKVCPCDNHIACPSARSGVFITQFFLSRYLQEKFGWSEELCDVAAFLIMSDIGNHLQPDAVYNCEQIGACHNPSCSPLSLSVNSNKFYHPHRSRRHMPQAPPRRCQHPLCQCDRDHQWPRQGQSHDQRFQGAVSSRALSHPLTCFFCSHAIAPLQPTAAGAVELRLLCPPLVGDGMDVINPKCVALASLYSLIPLLM